MSLAEPRNKSNKKFMVLSALGIFMVVDHHTFTTFHFFGDYIPYNSFFMPMFVFISGYFNKVDSSTKLVHYIWKKIKTLLVPYTFIALLVFGLQWLINWYKLGEKPTYPEGYLSYVFGRIRTSGSPFNIATPMWFVISLFSVLVLYAVIKKFLYRFWNSYVMLLIFIALHILAVYLAKTTEFEKIEDYLIPLKCLFFFPFLEMGIIYREHLEKKHEGLSVGCKIGILFLLLGVNMVRTMYLPFAYDVAFDSLDELAGFTSPYYVTPLVSSIVGILFWLTLVGLIGKAFYNSRFVNYMSCNTFWIMGLHITFFNILNCILMFVNDHITALKYFSVADFQDSEWYWWELSPNFKLAYLVIGILGPLGLKWVFDKIRSSVGKAVAGKKNTVAEE